MARYDFQMDFNTKFALPAICMVSGLAFLSGGNYLFSLTGGLLIAVGIVVLTRNFRQLRGGEIKDRIKK